MTLQTEVGALTGKVYACVGCLLSTRIEFPRLIWTASSMVNGYALVNSRNVGIQ